MKNKRPNDYEGEFGFDWMRDNYSKICKDYEALKKEYENITISGKEYFVPWLSMFPEQKNVSLLLKVKKTNDDKIKKDDVIKLPAKDGIRFDPEEVKAKDIEKNDVEIKVFCDRSLNKNTVCDLLDKNDNIVGKINLVRNDKISKVKVKFIKVMGNESDNTYNKRTFDQIPVNWVTNTIEKFNTKYFNQSLIKVENDGLEEMIIDVDSYIKKETLEAFISNGEKGIPRYNRGFDKELYKAYVQKNGNYKGVIFFLSAFHQQDGRIGHAKLYPTELNYILMTPDSIGNENVSSFAHELGHTLGLDHTWTTQTENITRLDAIEKALLKNKTHLDKYKAYPDTTPVKGSIETLKDVRERQKNHIKGLESEKTSRLKFIPKHPFNKATTENMMDYNGYDVPGKESIHNPNSERISFWKWQWDIMINEVKEYHGSR